VKSSLDDGTAEWYLSETKIQMDDVEGYYMFEWGQINPVLGGFRYGQNQHGINGIDSYVYIAYGSSLLGADFTMVNDPDLEYMAILSTTNVIPTPVVGDFDGLWFKRKGDAGSGGGADVVSGLGMDFETNEAVDMGLPSTVDSTTTNSLTETSHTHALGNIDISSVTKAGRYGALYNFWAATDARKITSSADWVVPRSDQWEDLMNFVDTYDPLNNWWLIAGAKLKEYGTLHWDILDESVTNEYGFSAVGGGSRQTDGFYNINTVGYYQSLSLDLENVISTNFDSEDVNIVQ
jgi:uncharacterized protein (TIGR02145 family)